MILRSLIVVCLILRSYSVVEYFTLFGVYLTVNKFSHHFSEKLDPNFPPFDNFKINDIYFIHSMSHLYLISSQKAIYFYLTFLLQFSAPISNTGQYPKGGKTFSQMIS